MRIDTELSKTNVFTDKSIAQHSETKDLSKVEENDKPIDYGSHFVAESKSLFMNVLKPLIEAANYQSLDPIKRSDSDINESIPAVATSINTNISNKYKSSQSILNSGFSKLF